MIDPVMKVLDKKFIFIVGAPRSGTTWLHRMLADLPGVAARDHELTWFSRYLSSGIQYYYKEKKHIERGDWKQGLPLIISEDRFWDCLKELTDRVYSEWALDGPGVTHILDKHPNYVRHMGSIERIIPHAKFIHIVRDGRDVSLSMISAARRIGFGASVMKDAAWEWMDSVRSAREFCKRSNGGDNYLEVSYEMLKNGNIDEMERVLRFAEIPNEKQEASRLLEEHAFQKKTYSYADPGRKAGEVMEWSGRMGLIDRIVFDRVAGQQLIELGYATENWWAIGKFDRLLKYPLLLKRRIADLVMAVRVSWRESIWG